MNPITPTIDFISSIILFGIIQGIVLLIVFLLNKPKGYLFIALLLMSIIIQQLESFLLSSGHMINFLFMLNVSVPFSFLLGPAVNHYQSQIIDLKKPLRNSIIHYFPFLLYFIYSFNYFLQPANRKLFAYMQEMNLPTNPIESLSPFDSDPLNIQGYVVIELIALHLIGYGIGSLVQLYKIRKQTYTSGLIYWLASLDILIFLIGVILLLSEGGIVQGYRFYSPVLPDYATRVFGTFSLYFIAAFLMKNSSFFSYGKKRYQKTSLTPEIRKSKLEKITMIMVNEKPFLSSSFSLGKLADALKMPSNHITEVINEELKINFFEMTNGYRISEAKSLLADDNQDLKIEQLAYSLGYKSKSTFFNSFKKETGQTPSQFRKNARKGVK